MSRYQDSIFLYPSIWRSIHVCALTLPMTNEAKKSYMDFLNSLVILLPDIKSKYSLKLYMERNPVDFTDNEKLFYWTFDLHDFINQVRLIEDHIDKDFIDRPDYKEILDMYSKDKLNKTFWSTAMWRTIHGLAAVYPVKTNKKSKEAVAYKKFIYALIEILSCPFCRGHLKENLSKLNINNYLEGRAKLFMFTYKLHSTVNKQTGDKNITYNEAKKMYKLN